MSSSKAFSSGDEPPTAEFFSSRDYVPTTKAYDNEEFLLSPAARPIRVLCEYQVRFPFKVVPHTFIYYVYFISLMFHYSNNILFSYSIQKIS